MTSLPRRFGNGCHGSIASRSPGRKRFPAIELRRCQKLITWVYILCYLMTLLRLTCPTTPWGWTLFAICSRFMTEPLPCAKELTWPISRPTPTSSSAFWPPSMMETYVTQVCWRLNMLTRRFGQSLLSSWKEDGTWMIACMKWRICVMTYQAFFSHALVFSNHYRLHPHRQLPLERMDRKAKAKENPKESRIPGNPRARPNGLRKFNVMVASNNSACGIRWASVRIPTAAFSICVRIQWMEKPVAKTMGRCHTLPHLTDSPKGKVIQFSPCMTSPMRMTPWRPIQSLTWTQFKTLFHLVIILLRAVCPRQSRRTRNTTPLPPSTPQRNPWSSLRRFHPLFQPQFYKQFHPANFSSMYARVLHVHYRWLFWIMATQFFLLIFYWILQWIYYPMRPMRTYCAWRQVVRLVMVQPAHPAANTADSNFEMMEVLRLCDHRIIYPVCPILHLGNFNVSKRVLWCFLAV